MEETIVDRRAVITGFCRIGCRVGEHLKAQRDCFCDEPSSIASTYIGLGFEGYDQSIIEWINEAVTQRLERENE